MIVYVVKKLNKSVKKRTKILLLICVYIDNVDHAYSNLGIRSIKCGSERNGPVLFRCSNQGTVFFKSRGQMAATELLMSDLF